MNFLEIREKIKNLKNDEDIEKFVDDRINELEKESIEKTVGQNYTTTFSEYIGKKIHYKPVHSIAGDEPGDLVYDDKVPYVNLIKRLKDGYNLFSLFADIYSIIKEYMPNPDGLKSDGVRLNTYASGKPVSIKKIKELGCAMCSENAGLAHNMFKILGIDSQVVGGYRNDEPHAYNIIDANGKGRGPMVIFDPSHYVSFNKGDILYRLGFFSILSDEEYQQLINGNEIVAKGTPEEGYKKTYNDLKEFTFIAEPPTYIQGLENYKSRKK